jgi:hypothetical protein
MCACHGPKQEGVQCAVTAIPQHSSVCANSLTRGPTWVTTLTLPKPWVTTWVGISAVGWVGGPTRVGVDPLVTTLGCVPGNSAMGNHIVGKLQAARRAQFRGTGPLP